MEAWPVPKGGRSYGLVDMKHPDIQAELDAARMRCVKCGHRWEGQMPQAVPPSVWVAWVKALQCPSCGRGRSVLLCK